MDILTIIAYAILFVLLIAAIAFFFSLLLHIGLIVGLMGLLTGNIFLGSVIVGVCFLLLKLFDNKVGDIAPNYTVFDSDGNHLFDIFKEK